MSACKKGELSIRLDHGSQLLTFESDVFLTSRAVSEVSIRLQSTPSDLVRTQLSRLSKSLHRTITLVDSGFVHDEQVRRNQARHRALAGIEKEHQETLARRAIIERRRELVELLAMRNEREQTSKRQQKQQMDAEAEQRRQAEELRKKEIARIQNEKENINLEERKKLAEELIAKGLKQEMEVNYFL
jgi:translation initiation factor 3 subunit A